MIIVILSKEFVFLINVKLFNFRENEKFNIREKKKTQINNIVKHLNKVKMHIKINNINYIKLTEANFK